MQYYFAAATVRLIGPTDAVSEGGGSFNARVEVIGKLEIPITLFLSTLNGTATGKINVRNLKRKSFLNWLPH